MSLNAYLYDNQGVIAEQIKEHAENVVRLDSYRQDPHLSGQAICLHCRHAWIAVTPPGIEYMDCPECNLQKGVHQGLVGPGDDPVFTCACGGSLWQFRQPDGGNPQCIKCGSVVDFNEIAAGTK